MSESNTTIGTWYQFALQQLAAESYLNPLGTGLTEQDALIKGNNGYTHMANVQAESFLKRYQIVHQYPNDASGFSATLLWDREAGQYTLSFRSTEYKRPENGGDYERDAKGADLEIDGKGFAMAQLVSMEHYWESITHGLNPDGTAAAGSPLAQFAAAMLDTGTGNVTGKLNVTGYSLGGHLATVFTELHSDNVIQTHTFNGAGHGGLDSSIEKARDLDAQQAMVAALNAMIEAQQKKISQLQSTYRSELQRELADIRARIQQAQPNLDKTIYREGLMELRAPQDGAVKDLATTTVGAVVQPGAMLLTLVPKGEQLFADVSIKNEDVGFVQVGQSAQIKLAAYPFQKYGMLTGKVTRVSADATESSRPNGPPNASNDSSTWEGTSMAGQATYKARVQLDAQVLRDPRGESLALTPGMQVVAEINQGKRTVLEYLLSPVQKAVNEAGRER